MEMQASNENQSYNRAHGISPPIKSPAVRLNIKIEDKAPVAKEVVRKVTKGHEVVEVDGFIFKRKRAQPKHDAVQAASEQSAAKKPRLPGPSPKPAATPVLHPTAATPAAHPSKPLSVALPEHISAATPAARTNPDPIAWASATPAAQTGVKPAAVATVTPAGATAATAALLQQLPTDAAEPDRLASLCELLCAAEIEDLGAAHTADDAAAMDAVRAVLTSFAVAVRAAATEGKFEAAAAAEPSAGPEPGAAEEDEWDMQLDLEARKAGLRSRLAAFTKEEEEWQEVIAQNNSWQQQQADEQDANAAQDPSAELGAAAIDHAAASGAAASGAAANAVDAEAKGQAGNPGAGTGAEDTGPLPGLGKANADHREQDNTAVPHQAGLLRKAEADAHRKVAIQVEGLCAMVSGVEELVTRAENHCTAMQAHYHKKRFCSFPHVESPARLIQELSQAKATLAGLPF